MNHTTQCKQDTLNTTMAVTLSDFDQHIHFNIFKRLDCRSVGKSRCVSKGWHSTLTSNYFIVQHLKHQPHVERPIVLYRRGSIHRLRTVELVAHNLAVDIAVARDLCYPSTDAESRLTEYANSCNGLVLFSTYGSDGMLVNAVVVNITTNEKANVDFIDVQPLPADPGFTRVQFYGIGYDSRTNDYHIIALFKLYRKVDGFSDLFGFNGMFAYEYSLKKRSWRRLPSYVWQRDEENNGRPCYLNDCLYGLFENRDLGINTLIKWKLGTDDDVIRYSVPKEGDIDVILFESRGLLYTATCRIDHGAQVWLMTENPTGASWSKAFFIRIIGLDVPPFPLLCLSSEDKIILDLGVGRLEVHHMNPENRPHRFVWLTINQRERGYSYKGTNYIETIVSPNVLEDDNA